MLMMLMQIRNLRTFFSVGVRVSGQNTVASLSRLLSRIPFTMFFFDYVFSLLQDIF